MRGLSLAQKDAIEDIVQQYLLTSYTEVSKSLNLQSQRQRRDDVYISSSKRSGVQRETVKVRQRRCCGSFMGSK